MFAGTGSANPNDASIGGMNAVTHQMDWQTRQALAQIGRDVELEFIVGKFQEPADNSTVRKTRGILEATKTNIITNVITNATATDRGDGFGSSTEGVGERRHPGQRDRHPDVRGVAEASTHRLVRHQEELPGAEPQRRRRRRLHHRDVLRAAQQHAQPLRARRNRAGGQPRPVRSRVTRDAR
ncbi:hypothetical protein GCM10011609_85790 [Lentzea pudingi]|uniref:Uncharacterized protein n=1 Tax=Lentzea pudingi TaxID=1789439 RepID=A0ABQ2ISD3_9PSEU|nr:hypothetical protein GCM10011609_85790 [Lentzea pudingi]